MSSIPVIPSLAVVVLLVLSCYRYIIYPAFISPLSKIPSANVIASVSPLWILSKRWSLKELSAIHAAHERYGPVVRLGPNEVSVNCVDEGLRPIYTGGFAKHDFYPNQFDNYGVPCMFSTAHSKPHAQRKRHLAHVYSKSYLQASTPLSAQSHIIVHTRLLPKLHRLTAQSPGHTIEVHTLANALTMDSTTAYLFGLANCSDLLRDDAKLQWQMRMFHCRRPYAFWAAELPWVVDLLKRVGLGGLVSPEFAADATRQLEAWGLRMLDGAEAQLSTGHKVAAEDTPVVYAQLRSALTKEVEKGGVTDLAHDIRLTLASEMLDHLGAGQETSAITLTYALRELARHPEVQRALREEIRTLLPSLSSSMTTTPPHPPSAKEIDALPLLSAVLTETLRLHAAIPGPQPRITPSTGIVTLGAYTSLPPNVRVSAQAYSLHRLPAVFPEPESWTPARWLDAGEAEKREMQRCFWAFGSGARMCVGSHLATQGLKAAIVGVVRSFVVGLPGGGGEEEGVARERLEQEDAYVSQPKGMICHLKFLPVE